MIRVARVAIGIALALTSCSSARPADAPAPDHASAPRANIQASPVRAVAAGTDAAVQPSAVSELSASEREALRSTANQALRARDFARAAPLLSRLCEGGELAACVQLADLLERGVSVSEDAVRARDLYERACAGGLQQACDQLGH
jgi:TPR repeat protein